MKSKEEIEQLATKHANLKPNFDRAEEEYYNSGAINAYESFIKGYTQCQEDMADKKYTEEDVRKCWILATNYALNQSNINLRSFINLLNKQD